MAGSLDIQIKGASELVAKLQDIKNLKKLAPALNKCLGVAEGHAKILCPVREDGGGNLRRSIKISPAKIVGKNLEGLIYASAEYAMYVEYGTGKRGNGSYPYDTEFANSITYAPYWAGMKAQPYMFPALINSRDAVKRIMSDALLNLAKGVA